MTRLSVIIVNWNTCAYLRECLASIYANGSGVSLEVVVVDNASTDGSKRMVREEFPAVRLIEMTENVGFSRANNIGIAKASGSLLALVNSDVVVHPGCFQELQHVLDENSDIGLVGPKILDGDGKLQRSCRRSPGLWNTLCRTLALDTAFPDAPLLSGREMRHWSHDERAQVEVLSGCFWMTRRSVFERVGGLDERFFFYAEDVDWCKRVRDAGWKLLFLPAALATHYGGASSARAPVRYSIQMIRANLAYWRKHFGVFGQTAYFLLTLIHHALRLVLLGSRRLVGAAPTSEAGFSYQRSLACLRWLLTGKELE